MVVPTSRRVLARRMILWFAGISRHFGSNEGTRPSPRFHTPHATAVHVQVSQQCTIEFAAGVRAMDRQQFAHLALSTARGAALYPHKYRRNLEDPWAHDALRPRNSR